MPVLKVKTDTGWNPVFGVADHKHNASDITGFQAPVLSVNGKTDNIVLEYDDLVNKPFWTEVVKTSEVDIHTEVLLTTSVDPEMGNTSYQLTPNTFRIPNRINPKNLKCTVNGTVYYIRRIASNYFENDDSPFSIIYNDLGMSGSQLIVSYKGWPELPELPDTFELSLESVDIIEHTVDTKYLPVLNSDNKFKASDDLVTGRQVNNFIYNFGVSWDRLANRPFYEAEVVCSAQVSQPSDAIDVGNYSQPFIADSPYLVTVDGIDYPVYGNTDETLYIEEIGLTIRHSEGMGDYWCSFRWDDTELSSTVDISIIEGHVKLKQIDEKFIPRTAGTGGTPVKGVDYWTEEDKAEIKAYVDEAILGGAW